MSSVENCNRMLNANGAQWLCSRLMDYDPSRQLLFRSVEILWNVLEKGTNRERLGIQLNDRRCMRFVSVRCSTLFSIFVKSLFEKAQLKEQLKASMEEAVNRD